MAKRFAIVKEKAYCSEEKDELNISPSFATMKEKAHYNEDQDELKTNLRFAVAKEGSNIDTTTFRGEMLGKWFLSYCFESSKLFSHFCSQILSFLQRNTFSILMF